MSSCWSRLFCLSVLFCVLAGSFGCASKTSHHGHYRGHGGKWNKNGYTKNGRSKATQRPYVIKGVTYYPIPSSIGYVEKGVASWYGEPFHGRPTSSGEIYDMYGDTAAHKTLPMNTMLLVKNLDNGRSTLVRINDRGPFVETRIIDLTYTKARELGMLSRGTAHVKIIAMQAGSPLPASNEAVASTPSQRPPVKSPQIAQNMRKPAGQQPPARPQVTRQPPVQQPPPKIPDFDRGNFFVQVGAFVKLQDARGLAHHFARRGRDVVIQQYPAAGMNLYRVLIFASHSLRQARLYEKKMEAEGFKNALLLAR